MGTISTPGQSGMETSYLTGQCLIAMPGMPDGRFARSVVFMCSHNEDGALGIVINKLQGEMDFTDLCDRIDIPVSDISTEFPIHFGGPVETGRGFVLHGDDYIGDDGTLWVTPSIGLTATLDVVRAMARGESPSQVLLALGYAGWAPGQLESEIQANGWLTVEADLDLVFGQEIDLRWEQAFGKLGIEPGLLASTSGHA